MKNLINSKFLFVGFLVLLSVGFIALLDITDAVKISEPHPHTLEFLEERNINTNETAIVVKRDGEVIHQERLLLSDQSLIIKSPSGEIIGRIREPHERDLEVIEKSFNSASDIALVDEQINLIIGNNEYLLNYEIRGSNSSIVRLLLMAVDQNNVITVDLNQEKVVLIEPANEPEWKLPKLSEIPPGQCLPFRGDEPIQELQLCRRGYIE